MIFQILKGIYEQLGILDIGYFDQNLKSLNNLYETYVLSVGEFDERIFLGEYSVIYLIIPGHKTLNFHLIDSLSF